MIAILILSSQSYLDIEAIVQLSLDYFMGCETKKKHLKYFKQEMIPTFDIIMTI